MRDVNGSLFLLFVIMALSSCGSENLPKKSVSKSDAELIESTVYTYVWLSSSKVEEAQVPPLETYLYSQRRQLSEFSPAGSLLVIGHEVELNSIERLIENGKELVRAVYTINVLAQCSNLVIKPLSSKKMRLSMFFKHDGDSYKIYKTPEIEKTVFYESLVGYAQSNSHSALVKQLEKLSY